MTPRGMALLDAWRAWDVRPGADHAAKAMEYACVIFADGESTLVLRRYLSAARRAGRSHVEIVAAWEDVFA